MKTILATIWLSVLTATCFAASPVLKGTLVNAAGEPLADALITYRLATHKTNAEPMTRHTDAQGQFEIAFDGNTYNLTFSKWGYAPLFKRLNTLIIADAAEVKVVLGRYDLPYGPFRLLHEGHDFDWDKAVDFVKDGNDWVAKVATDQATLDYQVIVNKERSLFGPDAATKADRSGDLISQAKAQQGQVAIRITPSTYTFKAGEASGWESVKGLDYVVFEDAVFDNDALMGKRKEKLHDKDFNMDGLRELYAPIAAEVAKIEDAEQKLLAAFRLETLFTELTQEQDAQNQMKAAVKENPRLLLKISGGVALDLVLQEMGAIEEADQDKLWSAGMDKILSMDMPDSMRVNFLRLGHSYADWFGEEAKAKMYADQIVTAYPHSYSAERIAKKAEEKAMIGQLAPDFTLTNAAGETVSLSDYRGKYVMLDFWATWCSPCIVSMPGIAEAYELIDKEKIEFLGVCLDVKDKQLARALKKHKITWPNLGDEGSFNAPVVKLYKINGIPKMMLINPDGTISGFNPRPYEGKELAEKLTEIMATPVKANAGSATAGGER